MRNTVLFYLNGRRYEVGNSAASMMLAEYLRYEQGLTGTKIVCAEGDCGACSVLRYFPHVDSVDSESYQAINSCITLVSQLDGSSLITVDALKENDELHEVQKAMVKCHGSQCGFCTPGFVITLAGLAEEKICKKVSAISESDAKNSLTGNLCRCTGYLPIIDAARSIDLKNTRSLKERFFSKTQADDLSQCFKTGVSLNHDDFTFFAPKTIKEASNFLMSDPEIKIMGGASDLGVIHNKRKIKLQKILSLHLIPQMYEIKNTNGEIKLGARVTHTEFRHFIKDLIPEFANYLDIFASPQIKNMGTVIGNIANASPIGDTPPPFLSLNAIVCIFGPQGEREVPLSKFFLAYRKTELKQGDIITAVKFKLPSEKSVVRFYKNSNRKDLDISAINMAFHLEWEDSAKKKIKDLAIAAGGVAATPIRFPQTENLIKKGTTLSEAVHSLHSEFNPLSDLRAHKAYRRILAENFFKKFLAETGVLS